MMPVILGIAGGTGSGKTTVARAIASHFGPTEVALIEQDYYYKDQSHLPMEKRRLVNYDHPDAFDMELFLDHINHLRQGVGVDKPTYSFETYSRLSGTERVEVRPVIMVEGIMMLVEEATRRALDIKVYVDADADVRFIRRVTRDVQERGRTMESVINQYMTVVRPMHLQFVEPSKRYADIIIPEGGHNVVAIDLIVTKILSILRQPAFSS